MALLLTNVVCAGERISSEPYISGDAFRSHCQFVLDEESDFNPNDIKRGDAIFVQLDYLGYFFSDYHPKISVKYILISHNHDLSAPGKFKKFLDDDKLYAWFTQNTDMIHPKLCPIPIGLVNLSCAFAHGHYQILKKALNNLPVKKTMLCYANFNIDTNKSERAFVYNLFCDKPWVFCEKNIAYPMFLKHLAESKFVLCPPGAGLDCYRTWEALVMGSYPIVKTSSLDSLYNGLPVLIVSNWKEVTQEFLEQKYLEMCAKKYNLEKLSFQYWLNLIKRKQDECCATGLSSSNNSCTSSMITYELNGGRFGDQLTSYVHAKWISYKYKIPLLYKPFIYSDQLVLDAIEPPFSKFKLDSINQVIINRHRLPKFDEDQVVYVLPYFPNYPKSIADEKQATFPIVVDWNDYEFIDVLRKLICPKRAINLSVLSRDFVNVALHVRTGGNYDVMLKEKSPENSSDTYFSDVCLPLNHPRDEFYIKQLTWLVQLFERKKIYVYVFADDCNPQQLCECYRNNFNSKDIIFDCRKGGNRDNENVLEDFFAMQLFDCIVCPNSNYSIMASKIGYNSITIFPVKYAWQGANLVMTQVKIEVKLRELQALVDRRLIGAQKLANLLVI